MIGCEVTVTPAGPCPPRTPDATVSRTSQPGAGRAPISMVICTAADLRETAMTRRSTLLLGLGATALAAAFVIAFRYAAGLPGESPGRVAEAGRKRAPP